MLRFNNGEYILIIKGRILVPQFAFILRRSGPLERCFPQRSGRLQRPHTRRRERSKEQSQGTGKLFTRVPPNRHKPNFTNAVGTFIKPTMGKRGPPFKLALDVTDCVSQLTDAISPGPTNLIPFVKTKTLVYLRRPLRSLSQTPAPPPLLLHHRFSRSHRMTPSESWD